jgi:hypothetical protein
MDEIVRWRAQLIRERAAAARSRMEACAANTEAAAARCANYAAEIAALTGAARERYEPGGSVDSLGSAQDSAFDRLQAEAMATAGGESVKAARLLVHRLAQERPGDAEARSALDTMILGAWGRLEQRARARLGADASPERVAHELIRDLGLDSA